MNNELDEMIKSAEFKAEVLDPMAQAAMKSYNKKHGKEIARLKSWAEECLFTCNREGYKYAIGKLRVLHKQSVLPDDVMDSLFVTSKERLDAIVKEAIGNV